MSAENTREHVDQTILQMESFVKQRLHRALWLDVPDVDVQDIRLFIRRGVHAVGQTVYKDCLDLASIFVRHGGHGAWTSIVDAAEKLAYDNGMSCVYIECIQTEWMCEWLMKRGYVNACPTREFGPPDYAITREQIEKKIESGWYSSADKQAFVV